MKSRVLVVFLLLAGWAAAQLDAGTTMRRVRVQVALANRGCDAATQVKLMGHNGPVAEATANQQCEADFFNVPAGTYHFVVSGQTIADTDTGAIEMNPTVSAELEVRVTRAGELAPNYDAPASALVSASDLGVPASARREVDRAYKLLGKQDLTHAEQKLRKAIAIYPDFAVAYNNLGVIYSRLGDRERERESLQKAISIDERLAPAYVNLGKMSIGAGDFASAETALNKASRFDPVDPATLILLAYAELMDRRFDEAVATSRKAHALDKPHALAHRLAANALEQKGQAAAAIAELELFLAEEPTGPGADAARKELADVRAVSH
jgi:tetratricopeptide (TPR) repeat protein